ncbi:CatB-related O-acetyltransferase [Paenibacillus sp. FSL L8-0436]|uniref:CatB-related O-acetyltransferase n=1 Tax=Paenibacillus sp. FSL L8-0436 TaxID=2954686 RepID=UPI003158248F
MFFEYFKYFKKRLYFYRKFRANIRSVHISNNVVLGKYVSTGRNAYIADNVSIGEFTYLNDGGWGVNVIESGTRIGKYCSIGPNVYIGLGNHPQHYITTHPILYEPYWQKFIGITSQSKNQNILRPGDGQYVNIGNDVWIGANVTIKDGVTIGDGSIIAGGSVVTKDVSPYSVVGGVPAVILKYRFPNEKIEKLHSIEKKWWDWGENEIKKNLNVLYNIDRYIEYSLNSK